MELGFPFHGNSFYLPHGGTNHCVEARPQSSRVKPWREVLLTGILWLTPPKTRAIPWEMLVGCWNGSFWNGPLFRGLSLVSGGEQYSSRIFCAKLFDLHIFAKQPIPVGSRQVERVVWSDQFMDLIVKHPIFMDWSLTRYHRISMDWSLQMHRMDFPWRWRSIYKVSTEKTPPPPKKKQFSVSIYHPYITNKKANHFFCCPHKNGGKSPKEDFPKFLSLKPARYSDTNLCCGQKLGGVEFLRKTCGNIETNEKISIISKTTRLLFVLVLFMM